MYEQYNQLVRSVAYLHIQNEQCHDVTQEVFVKAWKNIVSLKDVEKMKPWLMRITMNSIYDFYRKSKRIKEDHVEGLDLYIASESDQLQRLEDKEIVKVILRKLSDKHRDVVVLFYLMDFKISEIAESLGLSEGTVKSRLYNAKEKLKDLNDEMGGDYART